MAIPDYQTLMLPLLTLLKDGEEWRVKDVASGLEEVFGLSELERQTLQERNTQTVIYYRTGWSLSYLKKAGLLESTRRGCYRITPLGLDQLGKNLERIDSKYLLQFPAFSESKLQRLPTSLSEEITHLISTQTPDDQIEAIYQTIRSNLASELLSTMQNCTPERFERLVVDLLVKMGYGGTRQDAGEAIGRNNDGGIDGIIKEDRLGLDAIYIQAKRWDDKNGIGRPEVQKFAGALQGHRARKGVFLTTSYFTHKALDFVGSIDSKIVLIDGKTMALYMIDYGLGVSTVASYELRRIDSDYFEIGP
jgi:restriction system protein